VFVSLACAFQANGFGVWNANGAGVAAGFYPCSSYFNHSCAPNIGREMVGRRMVLFAAKRINIGEFMTLSYVDFKLSKEERRSKLKATYSFDCKCDRCVHPDPDAFQSLFDVPRCQSCKAKILRPLRSEPQDMPTRGRCPCCGEVFPLD
jgi:hypothetical protein